MTGLRMFNNVIQRFLNNPEDCDLHGVIQVVFLANDINSNTKSGVFLYFACIPAQGRRETKIVQMRRPQVGNQPLQLMEGIGSQRFQFMERTDGLLIASIQLTGETAQPHSDRRQRLTGLIVQVASNALTLRLLGRHHSSEQFTPQNFTLL